MAKILDIDDPLWKTEAIRTHAIGADIEGFHRVPKPIARDVWCGEIDLPHLREVFAWIQDPDRPGKVYICHDEGPWRGSAFARTRMVHSWFYFTDENLAVEFRMRWT
jgi:hypothetical protein